MSLYIYSIIIIIGILESHILHCTPSEFSLYINIVIT